MKSRTTFRRAQVVVNSHLAVNSHSIKSQITDGKSGEFTAVFFLDYLLSLVNSQRVFFDRSLVKQC